MNPAGSSKSFHKLDAVKDKNFWSVRVSRDIRLIVHKTGSSLLLCYVVNNVEHVSISTMHLAKGLESRAVAVMACDDEILPLQERIETVSDTSDLEEVYNTELHLLYVACTRARDQLLVTGVEPSPEFPSLPLPPFLLTKGLFGRGRFVAHANKIGVALFGNISGLDGGAHGAPLGILV